MSLSPWFFFPSVALSETEGISLRSGSVGGATPSSELEHARNNTAANANDGLPTLLLYRLPRSGAMGGDPRCLAGDFFADLVERLGQRVNDALEARSCRWLLDGDRPLEERALLVVDHDPKLDPRSVGLFHLFE